MSFIANDVKAYGDAVGKILIDSLIKEVDATRICLVFCVENPDKKNDSDEVLFVHEHGYSKHAISQLRNSIIKYFKTNQIGV